MHDDDEVLQGELVTLTRVMDGEELDRFVEQLREKRLQAEFELTEAPDRATVAEDLEDQSWMVWKIVTNDDERVVGYGGFVLNLGAPYVFINSLDQDLTAIAQDCLPLVTRFYFALPHREEFYAYMAQPVPDEIHELMLDAGFDVVDDMPSFDSKKTATYRMLRETYEAYYADKEDDEVEDLSF